PAANPASACVGSCGIAMSSGLGRDDRSRSPAALATRGGTARRLPYRAGTGACSMTGNRLEGRAMALPRRRFLGMAAAAAALPWVSRTAMAQAYPSRPITLVVPFPAAGPADVLARILGERMRESLGQPLVIENVTGAAGSIATARVARAT